jgi:predicted dehydrogenase
MEKNEIQLIGAGTQMRNNILPSLLLCRAQIGSVTTRSLEHSAQAVKAFGLNARTYDSLEEMLKNEQGEKAVVVMQARDAVPAVLSCLKAGRQVFVEKPCGLSLSEAQTIYRASMESGKGVSVGFMKRFAPVYRMLKQTIDSGDLGGVRSWHASFRVDASRFCASDADFVYFVAIHMLDLLRYLFGEVKSVSAVKNETGGGCSYAASFVMESGAVGTASFENRTAWTRESEGICVTLEDGFAETRELNHLAVHRSRSTPNPWQTLSECDQVFSDCFNPASGTSKDLWLRGFAGEMQDFWENDARVSDDNLRTTRLCEDFLESLRK